ncbi:hypothetical protein [Paucibacter soli]|uniref:hypothetical protein n=1 Tax=Paucibacter soli TaxID=3133433 RepID=UPI0030B3B00F
MMRPLMQFVRSLGWPGWLALALLAGAAGLALGLLPRWEAQTARLQGEADHLQRQLRLRAPAAPASGPAALTPQQWQLSLPAAELRQQRLADLLELGLRQGLVSNRTEHRLTLDASAGLERMRVTMPVQGGYAQVRGYIDAALLQDPGLSLDSLKLRRANPQTAEVDAELLWSLHARHPGAAPAKEAQP